MSRDNLKSGKPGFPMYGEDHLPKVNTMRDDKSQPDFMGVPILRDGEVMLTSAEELGDKPASCYTCIFYDEQESMCALIGPDVVIAKVIGSKDEGEPIEYWPCCSMQTYGTMVDHEQEFTRQDPDSLGLIWINAPETGQKYGGANCGGVNGGDDCDHYMVDKGEKWDSQSGHCRVLQHEVSAGAVCSAWRDDDELGWQEAQQLIRKPDGEHEKREMARDIIRRDK